MYSLTVYISRVGQYTGILGIIVTMVWYVGNIGSYSIKKIDCLTYFLFGFSAAVVLLHVLY